MASKPPFLEGNPAASSGGGGCHPPFQDRPQKSGTTNTPDGGSEKFPNRPQPTGSPQGNPQSVPGGGKLPFQGPSKPTQTPFKLGS